MQIIKKIFFILLISSLIIVAIEFYQYSCEQKEKYNKLGSQKFKEELVLRMKELNNSTCIYKDSYKEIMSEEEFKKICIKN